MLDWCTYTYRLLMSHKAPIVIADNQELTNLGLRHVIQQQNVSNSTLSAVNKTELIQILLKHPNAIVFLDYTLFDFAQQQDLINLCDRFTSARVLLLISTELSSNFVRQVSLKTHNVGIVFKSCSGQEIVKVLQFAMQGKRYFCSRTQELLNSADEIQKENTPLTKTEMEILKLLSLGKSSREIAHLRNLSMHTIMTHRKNIFRKLEVNTAYEASRHAMRMGLVNAADYEI